ncbi:hypothetical protein LSTR_LSTR001216 [Laodelphax striatellus]|uniref:Uncharacterized protein n=1 Tax=Laodelphax striatellus TaxID=195883 RepID=A0A482XC43_LAOST|nr:hypothetical protein LSTR_LSTR001216 [Laodelphax striatellus]
MDDREADPFGTLISIITLRQHEIGKLGKKINELKNRLTNIKSDIEVEKRRELELLNKASDDLRKESELRYRIASLNASIELADKLKSEHIRRIEKEKVELDEMKKRHQAVLEEKRDLWNKYEAVYESLDGAKEVREQKSVLRLLHFTLMKKSAELQEFLKEEALLEDVQENIIFMLSSKIDASEKERTDLVLQIVAQEKRNKVKVEEIEKLKDELEKLRSQNLPVNSISRLRNMVGLYEKASSRGSMERESLEQPVAKKMREDSGSQISASSQVVSNFKRILSSPLQQIGNFSSSLFSFDNLEKMNFVRPRKRIEEVSESTKRLMLQLEESKKAIIEKRQTELSQHSSQPRALLISANNNSDKELYINSKEVRSNMSQEKQAEKRSSNVYSQASSQKSNSEVDAQMELMPPPAMVAPQMNDNRPTAYYSQQHTQSDYGYQTQSQLSYGEAQNTFENSSDAQSMYPTQNSQVSASDYRRANVPVMNLPTEENNNRIQFKVEPEPMEGSNMDQPREPTYNATQTTNPKHGKENQFNFPSPVEHQEAATLKNNAYHNNEAFNHRNQTKISNEQTPMETTHDNREENYVVESEYFSSKKYDQAMTFDHRSLAKINSDCFQPMEMEMQYDDRVQSPDNMSFVMSPCSPMPGGLMSPPPPPATDTMSNMSGFGFQMENKEKRNVGFTFGSNQPSASSGGAIFKMF